VYMAPGI